MYSDFASDQTHVSLTSYCQTLLLVGTAKYISVVAVPVCPEA